MRQRIRGPVTLQQNLFLLIESARWRGTYRYSLLTRSLGYLGLITISA